MTTATFAPPVGDARVDEIRSLAEQGKNTNEIADALGLSYATTYGLARKNGITIARKMKVGDISAQIAERAERGLNVAQIAAELEVSESTVRKSAKENSIHISGRNTRDAEGNPIPKKDRISEKRRQRLVIISELFEQGVPSAEIARRLNLTREMIRQDLALLDISASEVNQQRKSALSEEISALATEGYVVSEIAERLGTTALRVRNVADKFGIVISRLKQVDHGTILSYQRGCTCELCRAANSRLAKESRERRISKGIPEHLHGTDTGYRNWQCKCEPCKKAGAETNKSAVTIPGLSTHKKHQQWLQEEDRLVQDRSRTARELAVLLNRTVSSVNTRRALLKKGSVSTES